MPILDLQRKMAQVGRCRIGIKKGNRPVKIETFRFTSSYKEAIENIAALYGGEVELWKPDEKGTQQFEVITEANAIPIVVAPGQVLDQWFECWSRGGCTRRCDGQTERLSGTPCVCPSDIDERRELAKTGKACSETTRFSFIVRDAGVLGLWRLDTKGHYAAVEMAGIAELLEQATMQGSYIPATLFLDQRTALKKGQTLRYVVPVIQTNASMGQVMESLGMQSTFGELGLAPQQKALPAPRPVAESPALDVPEPEGYVDRETGRISVPEPEVEPAPLVADPKMVTSVITAGSAVPEPLAEIAEILDAEIVEEKPQQNEQLRVAVVAAARRSDIDDELRHELTSYITNGRTIHAGEITSAEAPDLYKLFSAVARKKAVLSYSEDGRLIIDMMK